MRRLWVLALVATGFLILPPCRAADPELVLHYSFDEGTGGLLRDVTGNGHDGRIHGASYFRHGAGYGLKFDGADDYVDCGGLGLEPTDSFTLQAWIYPDKVPAAEVSIVCKSVGIFGMTYYTDGHCWLYGGGGSCNAPLKPGYWHQVTGTYDRNRLKLYLDGVLAASREASAPTPQEGSLFLGNKGGGFEGTMDEVRVYRRALPPVEIMKSYHAGSRANWTQRRPVPAAVTLRGEGFQVLVGPRGALQVQVGKERYLCESSYSYPGRRIGWNCLSEEEPSGDPTWQVKITGHGSKSAQVQARGSSFSLARTLEVSGDRVAVTDTLSNRTDEVVGVLLRHRVITPEPSTEALLAGAPVSEVSDSAENPSVFLSSARSHLGLLAEDTLSRSQFESSVYLNEAEVRLDHVALRPGHPVKLRWVLYPFASPDGRPATRSGKASTCESSYFDFINKVRRDWHSNFTVAGPFDFGPTGEVWRNPARLKAYLQRKRLKIVAPGPWLDYDNCDPGLGRLVGRVEYKKILREAKAAIKAVDPTIKVVGCIEGPFVSLQEELTRALFETLPPERRSAGYPLTFTEQQMKILGEAPLPWKDSMVLGPEGRPYYELYFRGLQRRPLMALLVYPAPGNSQLRFWLEQARFLLEEVGLDGMYGDGLGAIRGSRYGHNRWDGVTVDIDPQTGKILRRYTDYLPVVGNLPSRSLFDYVLSRRGVMVANGHHYTEEIQSYPIPRFLETDGSYDPLAFADGETPPLVPGMCKGQLDAPIALACRPALVGPQAMKDYARFVMKSVITHLRHGLLYYYYNTEIPETGSGSGEYGPINHMFPITPIELHEGWILGKERILSVRSIQTHWLNERKPLVSVFDLTGRPVATKGRCVLTRAGRSWRIDLRIKDWQEIAVAE